MTTTSAPTATRTPEWVSPCGRAVIVRALMGYWLTIDGTTVHVASVQRGTALATDHLAGVTA